MEPESNRPSKLVLVLVVVAHVVFAALTWSDIRDRPQEKIRGSKKFWRTVSAMNTSGALAYWLVGRRYDCCSGDKGDVVTSSSGKDAPAAPADEEPAPVANGNEPAAS
jgi:hypothetical protein